MRFNPVTWFNQLSDKRKGFIHVLMGITVSSIVLFIFGFTSYIFTTSNYSLENKIVIRQPDYAVKASVLYIHPNENLNVYALKNLNLYQNNQESHSLPGEEADAEYEPDSENGEIPTIYDELIGIGGASVNMKTESFTEMMDRPHEDPLVHQSKTEDRFYQQLLDDIITPIEEEDKQSQLANVDVKVFSCIKYKIKGNDTLYSVAKRNGLNVDTLASINDIRRGVLPRVGQTILIPNQIGIFHEVEANQTLSKIAKYYQQKHDVTYDAIRLVNDLEDPGEIRKGDKLFIPGAHLTLEERQKRLEFEYCQPVTGVITSLYGWREDPFRKGHKEFHQGLDIRASYGTTVRSIKTGTVIFAGWRSGYGNIVILKHSGGYESRYAHLSSITVSAGQVIEKGRKVGHIGSTGRSTGPHLHLEVRVNGETINPASLNGLAGRKGTRFYGAY